MPTARIKRLFRRYASPLCVLFGLLCGLAYAAAVYTPGSNFEARVAVALAFITAGPMGLSYLYSKTMRTRYIPFLWEVLTFFFALWCMVGVVFGARVALRGSEYESFSMLDATVAFLVGTIVGTVWMIAFILLLGVRLNVAIWEVERFPFWVGTFFGWLNRKTRR